MPTSGALGRTRYDGQAFRYAQYLAKQIHNVSGQAIDSVHFLAEEAPDATLFSLLEFF
jgi:hypothetical protein